MRKAFTIVLAVTILLTLCSCGNANLASINEPNSSEAQNTSSTDIPGETTVPSPGQTEIPVSNVNNTERGEAFQTFLSDNYQDVSDSFFGGIAGIAFIDLDRDGGIEMLIFDAGASVAMGVQFFDIINDKVECVSANLEAVGKNFGGEHMSDVIVNANYFDDFRLMKEKSTGNEFYIVESGNGAADFSYTELIRFGDNKGTLTLESLMYKHEDYDIDTGDITGRNFKIGANTAEKAEYDKAYKNFFSGLEDTGYESKGVFIWESTDYESNYKGLIDMVNKALTLY